ncbi:acyl-CoA desaturase [Fulvivirgaceae bacterium BMA12]|uniref:Acyl-CoA desaturase n=1 Tax=Agaribacillus aureus TaxID=3051825 RepID=A0ABT8LAL6_9BACT|nr:acyl-CoA desaturase [Fulvivirgaceae bacterium BMA12]
MQNVISEDANEPKRAEDQKQKIRFTKSSNDQFYTELTKRVNRYFKDNNISKQANGEMIFKTILILGVFVISYVLIISNLFNVWVLIPLAIINGFFTALIGLNIAHDAMHGAYSSNERVNNGLATAFNIIGANDFTWRISHNLIHHTFTNIPDHDSDIDQIPIIRLNPNQDLWKIHRFQYLYTFFFYSLTSLSWVFIKDYALFFGPKIAAYQKQPFPKKEIAKLFAFKAIYYTLFLVVPMITISLPWYAILLGFLLLHIVEGLTLALIFQLAHIVEGTDFPRPDQQGSMENSWAVHQMYTTADFARKSPLANFLFGGLNFQIEHHLFPKICHTHYRKLSPIVQATAKEYNLPFIEHTTFLGAIKSHMKVLKQLGAA